MRCSLFTPPICNLLVTIALCFTSLGVKASVVLNSTNFPDPVFRTYISGLTGVSVGGTISDAVIAEVKEIDVKNMEVSSLKGVEYFTALEDLDCSKNNLTSIDISKNVLLQYFICSSNNISSLDVTKNTNLQWLQCHHNELTSLDVTKNPYLDYLECNSNQLTSLDVTKNPFLSLLECSLNKLKSLDVSKNTKLESLQCRYNQITSLDVSNNLLLDYLLCRNNNLRTLNVANNTKLRYFNCAENKIEQLYLANNPGLTDVYCSNNCLTCLNLDNCQNITDASAVNQNSTRRFDVRSRSGSVNDCWALYVGTSDASRIRNLKMDRESKEPTMLGINGWMIVSDDLKKIPQKVEYEIYTGNETAGWMNVTVNYDVKNYGVYIDGKELTSLNFYDTGRLEITDNSVLMAHGTNRSSVDLPSAAKRNFDSNIQVRYPVGAYIGDNYHVYYAGTTTNMQKEWVVIGPEGAVPPEDEPEVSPNYDLNGDGKISTADIQIIINEMKKTASSQNMKYDLNNDGKISTADIQVIINEMKI